jgi:hypothetical protein
MRTSIPIALFATIAAAGLTVSAPSHAGSPASIASSGCATSSDGSGLCWGSLSGFLASSGPHDMAYFSQSVATSTGISFYAASGGIGHACYRNNAEPLWLQTASIPSGNWFEIQWNSQGVCTYLDMERSSTYE